MSENKSLFENTLNQLKKAEPEIEESIE